MRRPGPGSPDRAPRWWPRPGFRACRRRDPRAPAASLPAGELRGAPGRARRRPAPVPVRRLTGSARTEPLTPGSAPTEPAQAEPATTGSAPTEPVRRKPVARARLHRQPGRQAWYRFRNAGAPGAQGSGVRVPAARGSGVPGQRLPPRGVRGPPAQCRRECRGRRHRPGPVRLRGRLPEHRQRNRGRKRACPPVRGYRCRPSGPGCRAPLRSPWWKRCRTRQQRGQPKPCLKRGWCAGLAPALAGYRLLGRTHPFRRAWG